MTKKNFDEENKSLVLVFSINILAHITLIGKIPPKYHKSKQLTKFTLD